MPVSATSHTFCAPMSNSFMHFPFRCDSIGSPFIVFGDIITRCEIMGCPCIAYTCSDPRRRLCHRHRCCTYCPRATCSNMRIGQNRYRAFIFDYDKRGLVCRQVNLLVICFLAFVLVLAVPRHSFSFFIFLPRFIFNFFLTLSRLHALWWRDADV